LPTNSAGMRCWAAAGAVEAEERERDGDHGGEGLHVGHPTMIKPRRCLRYLWYRASLISPVRLPPHH
jgi:hypothetical protein